MIGISKKIDWFKNEYGLRNKTATYIKDGRLNLNTMISVFKYVVKGEAQDSWIPSWNWKDFFSLVGILMNLRCRL